MKFEDVLNNYIEILNCTSKDLSNASSLSTATISRYRNGEREPIFESKQFNNLISGIIQLAKEKNITSINTQKVTEDFSSVFGKNTIYFNIISTNLNELISRSKY